MGIGINAINAVTRVVKQEMSIINSSRRAAQIAKSLYPEVNGASSKIFVKKLSKDVGPEPVIGFLTGTFTNPVPGLGIVGFGVGRILAEGRKFIVNQAKNLIK